MAWSYWHRLEYFRIERGRRVLVHSEDVDDHGPYIADGPDAPAQYAQVAGEDYLHYHQEPPGRWLVVLWQLTDGRMSKRLCEVELHWRGRPEPVARQPRRPALLGGRR